VDEEPVDGLERALRQVLVRTVDRVAGLEADDALPSALGEERAGVGRILVQLGEAGLEPLEDGHGAGEVQVVLRVQLRDPGVVPVGRAEALRGLALLVVVEDLLDLEQGQRPAGLVRERDPVSLGRLGDGEADGQSPGHAVREAHRLDDALVILPAHEARERGQRAGGEHVEVGELARRERDHLERLEVVRALSRALDEDAAVRPDEVIRRDSGHARTSAPTTPSSSSRWRTTCALSSGVCASVSTTMSGLSGSS
jgi:hypothetical protein